MPDPLEPLAQAPGLSWKERSLGDAARVIEVCGRLVFPDSRVLGEQLAGTVRAGAR